MPESAFFRGQSLSFAMWSMLVVAMLLALEFAAILIANGGHFSFSLDDPYIHLALAEQLLHGHYGVNAGEPAAASSSILYPFLLAPLMALGFGQFSALIINVASSLASAGLGAVLVAETLPQVTRLKGSWLAVIAVALSVNLIGLAFTGMEHGLHVALTLLCLLGAMRFLKQERVPIWWAVALIVTPLIRYEGAALLLGGIVLLLVKRRWAWAALVAAAGIGLLGAFSLFLLHQGLAVLPSSILVKSAGGLPLAENMQNPLAIPLLISLVLCLSPILKAAHHQRRIALWSARELIAVFCAIGIVAHLVLGGFGWLSRYEIYALVLALFGPVIIHRDWFAAYVSRATLREVMLFSLFFILVFTHYVAALPASIRSSGDVYRQQHQMHRFVTEFYRAPVAVNDLGWVAYDNPNYVLDLWGLASETARKARLQNPDDGAWMDKLAQLHDVKLAMIFPQWLPQIPCGWIHAGDLVMERRPVFLPFNRVSFFVIPPGDIRDIEGKLREFAKVLPEGVQFEFTPAPKASCGA